MKKFFFVMVLMLVFAIPSMADQTVPVSAGGGLGPYCTITGSAVTLDLGAPEFVGHVITPASATVSTNVAATIGVAVSSSHGADSVVGTATGHSLVAVASWVASGAATDAVIPPESGVAHAYQVDVTRAGVGDPEDSYTGTITLSITCS
jgi:hypothetical protein